LRPFHVSADGRSWYDGQEVVKHLQHKAAHEPDTTACCRCCGRRCEDGQHFTKAFGHGEMAEGQEFLEGDFPSDDDLEDDRDGGDLDGDDLDGDAFDESDIAGHIEGRIKMLEAVEALARETDKLGLESAILSLRAVRLALAETMRRLIE
jgi:hypothetical protein